MLTKYSIGLWGKWYSNWGDGNILEKGQYFTNYHAVKCTGWKQINGEPHLVIDAFVGRPLYINRKNFNEWASSYGFGSVVLSTEEISKMRIKTWKEQVNDLMVNLIISLKATLGELMKPKTSVGRIPTLYEVAYSLLGRRLTLDLNVPKEVGCAQAISYVLKRYGCLIPNKGISGTAGMYDWLKKNSVEIGNPEVGCILLYATGSGNGKIRGHVFVVGKNSLMSNNSNTGLFDYQWTQEKAKLYYEEHGGFKPHYFRI
jgi:hypothetical protein